MAVRVKIASWGKAHASIVVLAEVRGRLGDPAH